MKRHSKVKRWTEEEKALLKVPGLTNTEIAARTGRTLQSVADQRRHTPGCVPGRKLNTGGASETTLSEDRSKVSGSFWQDRYVVLNRK